MKVKTEKVQLSSEPEKLRGIRPTQKHFPINSDINLIDVEKFLASFEASKPKFTKNTGTILVYETVGEG